MSEEEWVRPRDIISEGSKMPHEVYGLLKNGLRKSIRLEVITRVKRTLVVCM